MNQKRLSFILIFSVFGLGLLLSACGGSDVNVDPKELQVQDVSATSLAALKNCESQYKQVIQDKGDACNGAADILGDVGKRRRCEEESTRQSKAFETYSKDLVQDLLRFRKICLFTALEKFKRDGEAYEFCDSEFAQELTSSLQPDCTYDSMRARDERFEWKEIF